MDQGRARRVPHEDGGAAFRNRSAVKTKPPFGAQDPERRHFFVSLEDLFDLFA